MAAGDKAPGPTGADNTGTDGAGTEIDPDVREQLVGARRSIDNIDAALIHLLAERFKYTQQVGRLKATKGLPASDPDRERTQIARLRSLAEESHLDPAFAEKWFNFVVAEVIHHHEQLAEVRRDHNGH
jgi:chorismate mutase